MKERWFNYRPLWMIFLFLLLGSLFVFYIIKKTIVTIVITIIVIIILIAYAIIKRKIKYLLIPLISCIIGGGIFLLAVNPFKDNEFIEKPSTIQARVFYTKRANDDYLSVYADDCIINHEKQDFNLIIYIYDDEKLYESIEIGSVINFNVYNFYHNDIMSGDIPNSTLFAKDLRYTASCLMEDVTIIDYDTTFAEKIKNKIYNNLSYGLTNENLELAYSSLFGDTAMLTETHKVSFKLSGVAHLLAVSGLNVTLIITILLFVLRKLKAPNILQLILIIIVLLFYSYLCNFSVSVIRACIMSIMMLVAQMCYRRYDSLCAVSLSGILCFIINPLFVYDISSLMSFSCVLGIIMLYRPIKRALSHTKSPKWLVESISVSSATMVALTFIMAYFFKNFNLISIFSNIIIIPLFTLCFVVFYLLSFVSLIVPYVTYLLKIINPIMDLITLISNILGNLSFANLTTISVDYPSILCYFIFLLLIGRMCVADRKNRIFVTLPIVALLFIGLVV